MLQKAKRSAFMLIILCAVCTGTGSLFAQVNATGTLVGTVLDSSGAVVPGADVKITSKESGLARAAKSGSEGQYRFDLLPAGTYAVRVTAPGFGTAVYANVGLPA